MNLAPDTLSPWLIPFTCPLRSIAIASIPRNVLLAVRLIRFSGHLSKSTLELGGFNESENPQGIYGSAKAEAVEIVVSTKQSVRQVAGNLGIAESSLSRWVRESQENTATKSSGV